MEVDADDALLMQVDRLIDSEDYRLAEETIQRVLSVNAQDPRGLAYRAVIAHLQGDAAAERASRTRSATVTVRSGARATRGCGT